MGSHWLLKISGVTLTTNKTKIPSKFNKLGIDKTFLCIFTDVLADKEILWAMENRLRANDLKTGHSSSSVVAFYGRIPTLAGINSDASLLHCPNLKFRKRHRHCCGKNCHFSLSLECCFLKEKNRRKTHSLRR